MKLSKFITCAGLSNGGATVPEGGLEPYMPRGMDWNEEVFRDPTDSVPQTSLIAKWKSPTSEAFWFIILQNRGIWSGKGGEEAVQFQSNPKLHYIPRKPARVSSLSLDVNWILSFTCWKLGPSPDDFIFQLPNSNHSIPCLRLPAWLIQSTLGWWWVMLGSPLLGFLICSWFAHSQFSLHVLYFPNHCFYFLPIIFLFTNNAGKETHPHHPVPFAFAS